MREDIKKVLKEYKEELIFLEREESASKKSKNELNEQFWKGRANSVYNFIADLEKILENNKQFVWIDIEQCPKCSTTDLGWYLKSTRKCNKCGEVFRAENLVEVK